MQCTKESSLTTKYLQYFPEPVLQDLITGRWLPVVGAGMSLNAVAPPGKKMPLWGDLGKALENDFRDFTSTGAIDAISAYEHEFSRARLIERLSDVLLINEAKPGEAHKEFCSIAFDIVCTTNFDFLLELQYQQIPQAVYPVVEEDQLSLRIAAAGTTLLKLHGDLHHPSRLVVTEADYDGFLTKYPLLATYLANLLITRTAVLIGYSLDDPDFRQIWNIVSQRLGRTRRPAYVIVVGAQPADIARFARRGVTAINLPGRKEKYGEILALAFRELREKMRAGVLTVSAVMEERPLRELKLPRDSDTRLCFFSIPSSELSLYREYIFPAVENAGFTPVTGEDVVSPGDSINAKLDALIQRSTIVVVDPSSVWTQAELQMATARLRESQDGPKLNRPFHVIVISDDLKTVDSDFSQYHYIERTKSWKDEPRDFVLALVELMKKLAPQSAEARSQEAKRLLDNGEYRAAVIAAMTHLEATLREWLGKSEWDQVRRPMSMRSLFDRAVQAQFVGADDRRNIDRWTSLRNSAVHTASPVTKVAAEEVVIGIKRILGNSN